MYQDASNDISIKKRMLKNWAIKFEQDKSNPTVNSALTVGDAKTFDSLLDITEEIETQSQILLSDLQKSTVISGQPKVDAKSAEVIARLYRDIRKGLGLLTKTNFKGLPRTDVGSLAKYSDSLNAYFDILSAMNIENYRQNAPNAPIGQMNQDVAQLKAQLAQEERRQDAIERYLNDKKAEYRQALVDNQRLPMAQRRLAEAEIARTERDFAQSTQMQNDISGRINHIEGLANIEIKKLKSRQTSSIDFRNILQNYKVFVDTLKTGLLAYNAGLTGQLNKVGETLTASGMPMRRFL